MKKILYVEDDYDIANAVKLILSSSGFSVDIAFKGVEGIEKARTDTFDLIMLDVMLPDMSGWDIYAELKTKIKSKYVFLSAIPISNERFKELKDQGICDYIMKPFIKSDLIERIQKISFYQKDNE